MTTVQMIVMAAVAVFTVAAPLGAMGYLHWKKGAHWLPFLIGAAFFPLFALGLERIFHWLVLGSPLGPVIAGNTLLYAAYGGLAAGIFEETGRLAAFQLVLQDRLEPETPLSYGLGHGCVEAFVLVGLTMIANLALGLAYSRDELPPEAAAAAETIIGTPASLFFWAGVERLSAMILHVANSVLVFTSVWAGRRDLFPTAVLIHAAVNFIAVMGSSMLPAAVVELLILACSLMTALRASKIYRMLA